jgi:hypothetical protein
LKNIRLENLKTCPYQLQLSRIVDKDLCIRKHNSCPYFKAMYLELPSRKVKGTGPEVSRRLRIPDFKKHFST